MYNLVAYLCSDRWVWEWVWPPAAAIENSGSSPSHSGIAVKIEHGEQRLALLNKIGVHADFVQDCVRCRVLQTRGHRGCRSCFADPAHEWPSESPSCAFPQPANRREAERPPEENDIFPLRESSSLYIISYILPAKVGEDGGRAHAVARARALRTAPASLTLRDDISCVRRRFRYPERGFPRVHGSMTAAAW